MKISRNQFTPSRLLWPCLGAIGLLFLTTHFFNPAPAATAAEPFSCDNVTTIPQTECEALVSLYESTGGYVDYSWDWAQDDGWLTAADPCTWYGVGCANGHVTILSLSNNNLQGSLPTDLNDLTALELFFASGNRIYGEIPAELGELTQLQKLYLQSNRLSGEIPAALGNLSNLIDLYLSRNQLEGEIPAALVNLGTLNVSFSYNMLEASDATVLAWLTANSPAWANTQTVPPTNLQILNVTNSTALLSWDPILYTADDGEYIIGIAFETEDGYQGWAVTVDKSVSSLLVTDLPPEKTFYLAVQTLTWSHDDQQNTLESRFGEGVMVTTLPGLTCNQITDIPQSECEALYAIYDSTQGWQWYDRALGWKVDTAACNWVNVQCTDGHVTALSLTNNNLKGTLPAEIGQLTHLDRLSLERNKLTGKLPSTIGELTELTYLNIRENQLNGMLPSEIGELSKLRNLLLSENELTGPIPPELGQLENLSNLSLHHNQLTGPIPPELGDIEIADELLLHNNQLTGPIPPGLGNTNLFEKLNLSFNQLTGTIPAELGNLTLLDELNLSHNQLEGPLPPELFSNRRTYEMDLSYNQITGTIPDVFEYSHFGWTFDLSHNELTGPIPHTLPSSIEGGQCRLNNNHLSGPIPLEFGTDASYYYELDFSHNELTGTLPATLASFAEIRMLDLSWNQLTGSIEVLSDIDELNLHFDISHNQFTGPLPEENRFWDIGGNGANFSYNQFTGTIPLSFADIYSFSLAHNKLSGQIPAELALRSHGAIDLSYNQLSGEIPAAISVPPDKWSSSPLLGVSYNMLEAHDADLRAWLDTVDPDWEETQTVLPTNFQQSNTTYSSTQLSWRPISYTADAGYYEIGLSSAPAGPFTPIGQTSDKFGDAFTLENLTAGTNYYVAIRTFTAAHDEQQNNLLTVWSPPLALTTAVHPTPQIGTITPTSIEVGSSTFTLTVIGTNFLPDSVIYWNSEALTTTYHSNTHLSAVVGAEKLQTPQTVNIAVFTTGPGGGFSLSTPFVIMAPEYRAYLPMIR